ncbi:MAG: MBL fold metallo-hydrolase [Dehalococcoidia bacterium]|nr:MAG: MBL fold metallo-hydrolase [Dehalococcoidia bacterium]
MDPIAPGVYAIPGLKMGRSYLVEGDGGLALIDTSTGDVSARILDAITSIGRRPDELRAIVATHYHYDHTGNAAALIERTGARLCVHEADVPYVDGTTPWMAMRGPWAFLDRFGPAPYGLKVDQVLHHDDELPYAGGLRVIHAPGHTPGHIALRAPARGVLFAGDALMNTLGLRLPMSMSSHDMDQARASIARLADLDYDIALPGHGAPLLGRASEKVRAWVQRWV